MQLSRDTTCPVCGAGNQCAVAQAGSFDADCWCKNVKFSPQALERIPDEQRGKACLCPRCAKPGSEPD